MLSGGGFTEDANFRSNEESGVRDMEDLTAGGRPCGGPCRLGHRQDRCNGPVHLHKVRKQLSTLFPEEPPVQPQPGVQIALPPHSPVQSMKNSQEPSSMLASEEKLHAASSVQPKQLAKAIPVLPPMHPQFSTVRISSAIAVAVHLGAAAIVLGSGSIADLHALGSITSPMPVRRFGVRYMIRKARSSYASAPFQVSP